MAPPTPIRRLNLPSGFVPDHATSGLPGFPARDFFAPAGTPVRIDFYGRVVKLSGRPRTGAEDPGGPYGLSVYVLNLANGFERYVTHLGTRDVAIGQRLAPGSIIGTVAKPPDRETRPATDHVHMGLNKHGRA